MEHTRVDQMSQPIAFFDLDGTVRGTSNRLYPRANDVTLFPGVSERLQELRRLGYLLVGFTNQGGVSKGVITQQEVEKANQRTQELLINGRLDLIFYCPHNGETDGRDCDCKKPAPGMMLDALAALPQSTLEGSFVVGDNLVADGGAAGMLDLPFVLAETFRRQSVEETLASIQRKTRANGMGELIPDRVMGALVGMAVGDAFAAPVEFQSRESVRARYPDGLKEMRASRIWAAGEYTDDTQMALLIASSLLEHGMFHPTDIAKRFRAWKKSSKDVGIQIARVTSMDGYENNPEKCSRADYVRHPNNAAGNGAVMRCTPIAIFYANSLSMLLATSRRSARLTHGDPKAQSSCVLINTAIAHFLRGGSNENSWQHGMKFLTSWEQKTWIRLSEIQSIPEGDIASGGYTVATVEAAFWCFARSQSFESAIELAASLGDDADTVTAVTGALAGAYHGYSSIPERWRNALMDKEMIRNIALQLASAGKSQLD